MQIIHYQDRHWSKLVFEAALNDILKRHEKSDFILLEEPFGRLTHYTENSSDLAIDTTEALDLFDKGKILLPRALRMHKGLEDCLFYGVEDPDLYEKRREYAERVVAIVNKWFPDGDEEDESYIIEYASKHKKDPAKIKSAISRWGKHYMDREKQILPQVDHKIFENAIRLMESYNKDYAFLILGVGHQGIRDECESSGVGYVAPLKELIETHPEPTQEELARFVRHFK